MPSKVPMAKLITTAVPARKSVQMSPVPITDETWAGK